MTIWKYRILESHLLDIGSFLFELIFSHLVQLYVCTYINVRKINKINNINFRNTILLLKIRILTHISYIAIAIFYRNCDILSQLRYFAIAIFAIFRIYFFAVTKRNETAISCGNSASRNTAGNPKGGWNREKGHCWVCVCLFTFCVQCY